MTRLKLMFLALIAPEFIVFWAIRQWIVARNVSQSAYFLAGNYCYWNSFSEYGVSMTHGFFVSMGGFMVTNGDLFQPIIPEDIGSTDIAFTDPMKQTPSPFTIDVNEIARIDKRDLADRSKGDALTKSVALLQIGWFVVQIIARGAQQLHVTELELATLAFSSMNLVTYILWWDKPLAVSRPIVIPALAPLKRRLRPYRANRLFIRVLSTCANALSGGHQDRLTPSHSKVLVLWSGDINGRGLEYALQVSAGLAVLFGGIHCIAWRFSFPSYEEAVLWRVSSVSITTIPALLVEAFLIADSIRSNRKYVLESIGFICLIILSLVYVVSRVCLLILPVVLLRDLPPSTYRTVSWTAFIPHIS